LKPKLRNGSIHEGSNDNDVRVLNFATCKNLVVKTTVLTGFWWGNLREGDHLKDPDVDGRILLKCIFSEMGSV
jgi:hypothetical protein